MGKPSGGQRVHNERDTTSPYRLDQTPRSIWQDGAEDNIAILALLTNQHTVTWLVSQFHIVTLHKISILYFCEKPPNEINDLWTVYSN